MEKAHNEFSEFVSSFDESRLLQNRIIMISEGIDSSVAKRINSAILTLESRGPGELITIYQNSPGGEVNSGFAIFDMIRFVKSPVQIVNTGLCASIATVINCAVKKERRLSTPNCKFLIHQPLISGTVRGQASDLEITAKEILKTREKINELLSKECGQSVERVEKDTTRDYWMDAVEAKEYGLVSKIVESMSELP